MRASPGCMCGAYFLGVFRPKEAKNPRIPSSGGSVLLEPTDPDEDGALKSLGSEPPYGSPAASELVCEAASLDRR